MNRFEIIFQSTGSAKSRSDLDTLKTVMLAFVNALPKARSSLHSKSVLAYLAM